MQFISLKVHKVEFAGFLSRLYSKGTLIIMKLYSHLTAYILKRKWFNFSLEFFLSMHADKCRKGLSINDITHIGGRGDLLKGNVTSLAYLLKWVTRRREGSKFSKYGWRHLWTAPYCEFHKKHNQSAVQILTHPNHPLTMKFGELGQHILCIATDVIS